MRALFRREGEYWTVEVRRQYEPKFGTRAPACSSSPDPAPCARSRLSRAVQLAVWPEVPSGPSEPTQSDLARELGLGMLPRRRRRRARQPRSRRVSRPPRGAPRRGRRRPRRCNDPLRAASAGGNRRDHGPPRSPQRDARSHSGRAPSVLGLAVTRPSATPFKGLRSGCVAPLGDLLTATVKTGSLLPLRARSGSGPLRWSAAADRSSPRRRAVAPSDTWRRAVPSILTPMFRGRRHRPQGDHMTERRLWLLGVLLGSPLVVAAQLPAATRSSASRSDRSRGEQALCRDCRCTRPRPRIRLVTLQVAAASDDAEQSRHRP